MSILAAIIILVISVLLFFSVIGVMWGLMKLWRATLTALARVLKLSRLGKNSRKENSQ